MIKQAALYEKIFLFFSAALLFTILALRFWLHAQGKPFWTDETDGIFMTTTTSWEALFLKGMNGQASRSPLAYIFDKIWLELWNYKPQIYWDLRVFFRIIPASFWALSCVAIFLYIYKLVRSQLAATVGVSFVIAIGVALFYYQNSFLNIYAIETRAYSLWLFLSTLHMVFFLRSLQEKKTSAFWWLYGTVCFLLVFTTYAALAQVAIGLSIFLFFEWREHQLNGMRKYFLPVSVIAVSAFICGAWYYSNVVNMGYGRPTLTIYYEAVREVVLKSFHHHSLEPAFLTLPLFLFFIPFFYRRNKFVLAACAFAWLHMILSFVMFKGSQAKGGIYASRYVIYLIPSLTWFYLLGLFAIAFFLFQRVQKLEIKRLTFLHFLFVVCAIQVVSRAPKIINEIHIGLPIALGSHVYGVTANLSACDIAIPKEFEGTEQLNRICRVTNTQY